VFAVTARGVTARDVTVRGVTARERIEAPDERPALAVRVVSRLRLPKRLVGVTVREFTIAPGRVESPGEPEFRVTAGVRVIAGARVIAGVRVIAGARVTRDGREIDGGFEGRETEGAERAVEDRDGRED
jgi:hypothetical protein